MKSLAAWVLLAVSAGLAGYVLVLYPLLLQLLAVASRRSRGVRGATDRYLPPITILVPVHNEEDNIGWKLEALLEIEYPRDLTQVLVVSDASSDGTDAIVQTYAARGVELVRLPRRGGKTAAENAALPFIRTELVVNTDASVGIHPDAIARLVAPLADPEVGVTSSHNVSVSGRDGDVVHAEGWYNRWDMHVRRLESEICGIVGASGALFACRRDIHAVAVPDTLSRDFATPLIAKELGYRSVLVPDAICTVRRSTSLRAEYRRKVRTMARGIRTLGHKKHLLNPLRFGAFAWVLLSHKVGRWLIPPVVVVALAGIGIAVAGGRVTMVLGGLAVVAVGCGAVGWWWPRGKTMPRGMAAISYLVLGTLAGCHAWVRAFEGNQEAIWEPTRR